MAETVHLVPIDAIDEAALIRDRTGLEPEALEELRASIAAGGLRMPVEVFALAEPREGRTHGLISGFRRLAAVRALHGETGEARYARIAAFVRAPEDTAAALAAMVEENEIREELSPWERGRMLVMARDMGVFGSIEAAVDGLHPAAGKLKRMRLRALARVAEELEGQFTAPERLSQAEMLRLAAACRAGFARVICTALAEAGFDDPDSQWATVLPVLTEAERAAERAGEPAGAAPRRVLRLGRELTVRREAVRGGYLLRFTGRDATLSLLDPVLDEVEIVCGTR